jgi:site-specific recombinase XerD
MNLLPEEINQDITITQDNYIDDEVKELLTESIAKNTRRGYRADWDHFEKWCSATGKIPMPATPETIATYLKEMLKHGYMRKGIQHSYKASAFERRLSAISQIHQALGYKDSPTHQYLVRTTMKGIRRKIGTNQKKKAPVEVDVLRQMVAIQDDSLSGIRNRVLLVVGFTGAFRRSELVAINQEDIQFTRDGVKVFIPKSKTDQDGEGYTVGLPYGSNPATCPVRSLQDWLHASGIESGAVFRRINRHGHLLKRLSAQSVRLVVCDAAEKIGLDPKQFAGHSLRSGFITTSYLAGKTERAIMKQSRHESVKVMRSYIREADIFQDNAASGIGL